MTRSFKNMIFIFILSDKLFDVNFTYHGNKLIRMHFKLHFSL